MKHFLNKTGTSPNVSGIIQKCRLRLHFLKSNVVEKLKYDCALCKSLIEIALLAIGVLLYASGSTSTGFAILTKGHRFGDSRWTRAFAEWLARWSSPAGARQGQVHRLVRVYDQYDEDIQSVPDTAKFFMDPRKLLGSLALVLKSPRQNEKGVLVLCYSPMFPLFAKLFDIDKVARKYYLVLEPSWSGFFTLEILYYSRFDFPVFVQASEPRDAETIQNIRSNLTPVPISANWWLNHQIFRPLPEVSKGIDIVMVAAWTEYKRHYRFFSALMKLRKKGVVLKAVLIGYPLSRTKDDIFKRAKYYGIHDQIEIYENVPYEQMNYYLNLAKVNVLWSRKEGVNRAIIEGMLAGVPCILRDGFNYGYHYPYINPLTGCYSSEEELPKKLLWMVDSYQQFAPREWVMTHMSCQKATEVLTESIKKIALKQGERWTNDLAVKVNRLNGMKYWDENDMQRFECDYKFLESAIRA